MGVVVARFQTPELHPGHIATLVRVSKRHDVVLVIFGRSRAYVPTMKNPLNVTARQDMVEREWGSVMADACDIRYDSVRDCRSDELWSKRLDQLVAEHVTVSGSASATLYGSRDSFLTRYCGKLPTV